MRSFNFIFTILLLYIIAALTFWWFSLEKQSDVIAETDIELLKLRRQIINDPNAFEDDYRAIIKRERSREKQYIGEGLTFLLVTLAGAAIVYRSFRKTLQLSEQQNNFMLAITHELKSPIAGIKLGLQTMQRHHLDDDKKAAVLQSSVKEANRLDDLCSNILLTSQIDGRQYKLVKEKCNLSILVSEWCAPIANKIGARLILKAHEEVWIHGDKLLLHLALNNLIDNALKYGGTGKITVSLSSTLTHAILSVADEGEGIAFSETKKVFQKFYRIGSEHTRKQKGTGLGLYLTKKIVEQHKGTIAIRPATPHGLIVAMSFRLTQT